jgi:hypothetical protein
MNLHDTDAATVATPESSYTLSKAFHSTSLHEVSFRAFSPLYIDFEYARNNQYAIAQKI